MTICRLVVGCIYISISRTSSTMVLQLWKSLGLLDNSLPFRAVLYLFCPLHKLHLLQIIPDIIIPSRLRPSSWSSCEWFPFVYCFHYAGFGHSICVSKPTHSLGFNIIYFVPVFNSSNSLLVLILHSISRTCVFIFQIISVLCGCGSLPGIYICVLHWLCSPLCKMVLGMVER